MRYFVLLIAFIALLAVPAGDSYAARFSGKYLLSMCSSDENGNELTPGGHLACQAYIAGVMDYHQMMRSVGASYSVDFCIPEGTSMGEIQGKMVAYLSKNRQLHDPFIATPAVALALSLYYPCKKK